VFKFTTTAPTSTAGFVTLAFDYDALDLPPSTMSIARSYHDKSGGAPWSNWALNCDLAQGDRLPEKYIRVGLPPTNNDLKTYDVGNLQVCTEGTAAATVGYLEVDYVVDLMTPQIQDPVGGSISYGSDSTHEFLSVTTIDNDSVIPFTTNSAHVMTFYQSWEGVIILYQAGTVLSAVTCTASGTIGSAVTTNAASSFFNAAATSMLSYFNIRALPGTILTFATTCTTLTITKVVFATAAYAGLDFTITSSFATLNGSSSSSSVVPPLDLSKVESNSPVSLSQSMIDQVVALRNSKEYAKKH
jgi:hypothetical protein